MVNTDFIMTNTSNFDNQLINNLIDESVNYSYDNRDTSWIGSRFEKLIYLQNDERGKWGEKFLFDLIMRVSKIESKWDGDCNTNPEDGGIYDILVNPTRKLRTEAKTAFSHDSDSEARNWQHENIYAKSVWDKLVFLDVDYDKLYLTVLTPENMEYLFKNEKDPILGKKATLRKAQEDKWKFDCSPVTIKNAIDAGYTFCYNIDNPDVQGVADHLVKHFG